MLTESIGHITAWVEEEIRDDLGGADLTFNSTELCKDSDGVYAIDSVIFSGFETRIEGSLFIEGNVGRRCEMAIHIESATCIADLPEGLANEDPDIRELAEDKLHELDPSVSLSNYR